MSATIVAVAGASGDLGGKIIKHIVRRGGIAHAIVRKDVDQKKLANLEGNPNIKIIRADLNNPQEAAEATKGAYSVVSCLQGLGDVIIDTQYSLLEGAVASGVKRFIPSDFSLDFIKTPRGNRNLDLRFKFHEKAAHAPIAITGIYNGGFMEVIKQPGAFIDPKANKVSYWGSADQLLDFTWTENVADFTAAAALDPNPLPAALRIAGQTLTPIQLAESVSEAKGAHYEAVCSGPVEKLQGLIGYVRAQNPASENEIFPPWQGMMYGYDMFSGHGKLHPLDNEKYDVKWISVKDFLKL